MEQREFLCQQTEEEYNFIARSQYVINQEQEGLSCIMQLEKVRKARQQKGALLFTQMVHR